MLRSINSPSDPHDDHLRLLLDQRTTRADLHSRYSALSQFSDTPSVYSRPIFSPRSLDREPTSPSEENRCKFTTNPSFGTQSNGNHFNDPAASMLDLDEDPRSSIAFSDIYNDEQRAPDDDDDDDDEPLPRMSLLGPKMRFHSRAPWEMEDGTLQEEDEPDYGTLISSSKKGFGFSSPRPSSASRPSGESSRSQTNSKKSFETTTSQISYPRGALYALAQESLSTSSLRPSNTGQKTGRGKFSLGRVLSESPPPSVPSSPNPSTSNTRSSTNTRSEYRPSSPNYQQEPMFQPTDMHTFQGLDASTAHRRPSYSSDNVHPYANPDLALSYIRDDLPRSPHLPAVSRSDSISTVTESVAASSLSRSDGTRATLAPDVSGASISHKSRISAIQGKEISSPIPAINGLRPDPSFQYTPDDRQALIPPQGVNNLPGWTDRVTSPAFALISLEEARAQRSRSATAHPTISHPSASIPDSSSILFPDTERDTDGIAANGSDQNGYHITSRARARSISTGAKAKNALHTIVGQSRSEKQDHDHGAATHGKTLKHKKSGFMRLFNSGRPQEKDEKPLPPPVPPLSDAFTAYHPQQVTQKMSKMPTHRVPVPGYSPPIVESPQTEQMIKPSPGLRRAHPPLSINTMPHNQGGHGPVSAAGDTSFQTRTVPSYTPEKPWMNDSAPQSAPANVSEFPSLKLRPVSTVFSAQFAEHIVAKDSRPSLETDLGTPSSSNNVFSPITPGSSTRSERLSDDKPSMVAISEDQSAVIRALQDQIISAKRSWQRQIWELEGQVRDLKAEVDDLRSDGDKKDYCDACGRGEQSRGTNAEKRPGNTLEAKINSVVHRPRARTGTSSRFASAVS